MPKLIVRRTGNSLSLSLPREIVRDLALSPGDEMLVELERVPALLTLAGKLKGRLTAEEFTRMSNEGEEVD